MINKQKRLTKNGVGWVLWSLLSCSFADKHPRVGESHIGRHGKGAKIIRYHYPLAAVGDSNTCVSGAQVDSDSESHWDGRPRHLPLLHLIFDHTSNLSVNAN